MSDAKSLSCETAVGPWGSEPQPRIVTPCPACGGRSLFIGSGGHLTCSYIPCRNPSVASEIEAMDLEIRRLRDGLRTYVFASMKPGETFTLSPELTELLSERRR